MTRRLATAVMFCAALATSASARQAAPTTAQGQWSADLRQWWSDTGEQRVQLNLRAGDGSDRWGFGVPLAELEGLPPAATSGVANDVRFVLTREAGVFRFQGSFDNGRGNGSYTFSAAPAYITGMGALGYRTLSNDDLVRLAVT